MEVLLGQWANRFSENFEIHNLHGPCGPKNYIPCISYENKVIPCQYWFELWTLDRNKEKGSCLGNNAKKSSYKVQLCNFYLTKHIPTMYSCVTCNLFFLP
jgi:hypothetical protein